MLPSRRLTVVFAFTPAFNNELERMEYEDGVTNEG